MFWICQTHCRWVSKDILGWSSMIIQTWSNMACSMLNGLIISKLKEIKNHIARYLWSFLQTDGIEAAELKVWIPLAFLRKTLLTSFSSSVIHFRVRHLHPSYGRIWMTTIGKRTAQPCKFSIILMPGWSVHRQLNNTMHILHKLKNGSLGLNMKI